jgi:hypothetical protein
MKRYLTFLEFGLVASTLILFLINWYLGDSSASIAWVVAFAGWGAALDRRVNGPL